MSRAKVTKQTDAFRMEQRRMKIAALVFEGVRTKREIGRRLGVHHSVIVRDWKWLLAHWQDRFADHLHEEKMAQVAELMALGDRYMAAWHDSRKPTVTDSVEDVPPTKERPRKGTKKKHEEKSTAGDPRFLDGVLKCKQEIAKILGFYPAEPKAGSSDAGSPTTVDQTERDAILAALAARFGFEVGVAVAEGNGDAVGQDSPGPVTIDGTLRIDTGPVASGPDALPGPVDALTLLPPSGQDGDSGRNGIGHGAI